MKKINLATISVVITLVSCMLFPIISHAGDFIQPISETDASVSNPQSMSRIQSFSARKYTDKVLTVSIDAESLKQNSIAINIPGESVILLYPEFLNSQSKVPFSWVSAPPSIWGASAEIGVYDGIVSGQIKISRQIDGTKVTPGRTYEIRHLQGNTYALRKFDHNKIRQPGDEGFPIPLTSPPSAPQKKATSVTPDKKALAATAANPVQIDIQFVYTKKSKGFLSSDIYSNSGNLIRAINSAFERSGVYINARLVNVLEIDFDDGAGILRSLSIFESMPLVKSHRDNSGADISVLFIGGVDGDYCGRASGYLQPEQAYAVVNAVCPLGLTFAHEVAHIFGADHNVEDSPGSSIPYARGYYRIDPVAGVSTYWCFHTIMSRSKLCPVTGASTEQVAFYSNSNLIGYGTIPSTRNIPTKLGTANADNARVLNEQAERVALFRPTKIDPGGVGSGGLADTLKKYLPILFNILN
jgi:Metallo-peptidase family M12B Reprolysin-like